MNILRLHNAELAYGEQSILHDASFTLNTGEHIALIGRNGTGKSTLLKVLAGSVALDDGECWHTDGIRITTLSQETPEVDDQTLFEVVAQGLSESDRHDHGDWHVDHKIERVMDLLSLPRDKTMQESSGGVRRRTLLAQALVDEPDLLLLDEPTNHLDIASIEVLQAFLKTTRTTFILISHDRALVDDVATRIIELDRGNLTSYPGNFATYQQRKEKADAEEAIDNRKFDQVLAKEEGWIREGIKARRTRNEGRVRRLEDLRKQRAARLEKQGNAKLKLDSGDRSGKIVCSLEDVSFGYSEPLISGFSAQLMRGDKVAIIGPNGCGKSTLIQLILGELSPTKGQMTLGTKLQFAYFDQQRSALDINATVRNNVCEGSDQVTIGNKTKHIAGYLADFLFPPGILNMPVSKLSGGEKNRLLMAKLFAEPANLLILDEPTNDLDVETLELFEELLTDYQGTVILVSHDRAFIDAVATSVIVFEEGGLQEYVGGYTEWQRQIKNIDKVDRNSKKSAAMQVADQAGTKRSVNKKKLSYKVQRELDALPGRIEKLETEQATLQEMIAQDGFYQQPQDEVKRVLSTLQTLSESIDKAYSKWEELS